MNESDRVFARQSAVLDEFLHQAQLLVEPQKKMPYMFDFPKTRVENLEEQVKKGLPLPLAEHECFTIETLARKRVSEEVIKDRIANERHAQARAKYRRALSGEESQIRYVDEDRIRRETEKELNDAWRGIMEHQAAL